MAVFVLDKQKEPLMSCSEKHARWFLERGCAVVPRMIPFTIRLKDRWQEASAWQPVRLKLDPGSNTTEMDGIRGQADRFYRDGGPFYLAVVINVSEPSPLPPDDGLGVDRGMVNRAADSDGKTYSDGQVHGLGKRHAKMRQRLQKKGTQCASAC